MVSLVVVLVIGFLALLFAYLDWWADVLAWFGNQAVFMDLGFYLFFHRASSALVGHRLCL